MSKAKPTPDELPEVLDLFKAIAQHFPSAVGFQGVIVRTVAMKYATKNDFFSGVGAAKAGGRWNRVGLEAVYASLDVTTATHEAFQDFVYRGFPMSALAPRVTAGAKVTLAKVLELTDATVRKSIGFTLRDLVEEDWRALQKAGEESWTQAIGRGCYLAGFDGLIVPSARHNGGRNIVLFPDNIARTGKIEILGEDQLPK